MSSSYQLKSHPNKILYEHLRSVASSTKTIIQETFQHIFTQVTISDLVKTAYVTGATHDIGKGTTFFQDYILTGTVKQDPLLKSHSMISSLYCSWVISNDSSISDGYKDFLATASSLAIQGHHGSLKYPINYIKGLENFYDKDIFSRQIESAPENTIELEKISHNLGLPSFMNFSKSWENYIDHFEDILMKSSRIHKRFTHFQEPYFLINLLYSSLLDADRMDAAGLIRPERTEINTEVVKSFVNRLGSHAIDVDSKSDFHRKSEEEKNIDEFRNILFNGVYQISKNQDLNQKIFTLTAPTGLGKTLSSINFAVNIRERIKEKKGFTPRIIYVAPFISILDQNIKVLEDVFQTQSQRQTNLLLMHHHLAPVTYTKKIDEEQTIESYSTSQSELLIQGWNSEIVVTTFIQFFNTIFGRYASQLRRLNNLVGSIVILDEVQSIPFEYWNVVRNVLLFLSNKFSVTVVMMTATQPLIFDENETKEIAPSELLNNIPQRVLFKPKIENAVKLDELCRQVNDIIKNYYTKNILIEMNTISNAIEVYRSILSFSSSSSPLPSPFDPGNLFFLSSQIIPKDRRPRIERIKERLNSGNLVLVSTQVVEAGVDLDFDIAIRDIGPIDSIVQTAGRCNRNGKRKPEESPFFIYRVVNDDDFEFAKYVYGSVSIEVAISLLKEKEYNVIDLVTSYYLEIKRRRSSQQSYEINTAISQMNYENVEEAFKLIDEDYKEPVFVEEDENAKEIWKRFTMLMEASERPNRNQLLQLRYEMEQYMIGVSEKDVKETDLQEASGIYRIKHEDVGRLYDKVLGFVRH